MFRCIVIGLVLSLSIISSFAFANSPSYSMSYSNPQKINNYLLKTSYTFQNKVSGATTIIAKQLAKPQVARLLTFVISRRFAAFAALGTIAVEAGISTIDHDGQTLLVQKLPDQNTINSLKIGDNDYIPLSNGVLSTSYCMAGLAQLNYLYPAMRFIAANQTNWCELVTKSPTHKELHLIVSGADNPVGTKTMVVQPQGISRSAFTQPIKDHVVVKPEVVSDIIFEKAKPEDLAPLFDYNELYQSPAAIEAINEYNSRGESFPLSYPDITSPSLDKPVTSTPNDSSIGFPAFCNWATPICSFLDWFKDDSAIPEPEKHQVHDFDKNKLPTSPEFNFKANCPAPEIFNLNLGMASAQISFPYDYACSFAIDIRPFVILAAWLNACYIFIGFVRS